MHDDQIRDLLRTLEDDRTPDPAFADALYQRLHVVSGAHRRSRAPFVLLAAALLTILAAGLAVGTGLLRLPETVDASGSPLPSTSGVAVASPSATAAASQDADPSASALPSEAPDPTDVAGSVLFAEADGLRIRSEPSEAGELRATIRRGQLMGATGSRADSEGTTWYEVRIGPGDLEGWVAAGPDGSWLRLVRDGAVAFTCGLCGDAPAVVSVDPFGDSSITTIGPAQELSEYRWSPDGGQMAASRGGTTLPYRIVILDPAGGELDDLGIGSSPTWSPDGSRLAWLGEDGLTVTDENLEPSAIDLGALSSGAPFWSPDGTRFAVIANENPGAIDPPVSLFIVPATGGEAERLTGPSTINGPTWGPDGSVLGFSVVDLSGLAPTQAFVIPTGGGDPEPLFGGDAVQTPPIWSPDGTRLAVVTPDGIVMATGRGSEAVTLVPAGPGETMGELRWSPSGQWLLYSVSTGREPTLFIVPSDGGGVPRAISPEGVGGQQGEWQPVLVPLR
jgi:Tol biopolymer transport system component